MASVLRILFLVFLLGSLAWGTLSHGADRTLVFTHSDSAAPYAYLDNGTPRGLLVDFWAAWAEKAGVTPVFKLVPYDQSLAMVANGSADVHMGVPHHKGQSLGLELGPDLFDSQVVLMVRENKDAEGVLDLRDMEVGVVRGEKAESFLRQTYPFIKVKVFDNDEDLFRQAAEGKLHAFAMEPYATLYALSQSDSQDEFEPLMPLFQTVQRPATAPGRQGLMRDLKAGLAGMPDEARRAIFTRWIDYAPSVPTWFWPALLAMAGATLTAVLAASVLLLRVRVRGKTEELRRAMAKLRRQEEKYRNFFRNAVGGVFLSSLSGKLLEANPSFRRIIGAESDEELMEHLDGGVESLYADPAQRGILVERLKRDGMVEDFETVFRRMDGRTIWVRLSANAVKNQEGGIDYIEGVLQDITSQKLSEQHLEMRASQDALTGLPNRYLFQDRLDHALANARRYGRLLALLFVDLDDFKIVNDRSGHQVGDLVLKDVGRRLRKRTRDSDTVARLGGDEFAIILESVAKPDDAGDVATKLVEWLSEPYAVDGTEHVIGASVGICVFPDDGEDSSDLLNKADKAMYKAKELGRNFCFYSEC